MLFARNVVTSEGLMCRDCGRAVGRQALNRTFWTGWWGLFSFFANFAYIAGNAWSLMRLSQLPATGRPPVAGSLDPGRSIFARSGLWFVIFASSAVIGNAGSTDDSYSSYAPHSVPAIENNSGTSTSV